MRAEGKLSAFLDKSQPELGTWRQHYERCIKQGGEDARQARKKLRVPPCPEAAEHLVRWTYELFGRDGFNFGGANLLSNREAEAFFRLRGITPDPLEVEGLFILNAAYCNPEGDEEERREEKREEGPTLPPAQRGREIIMVDGRTGA